MTSHAVPLTPGAQAQTPRMQKPRPLQSDGHPAPAASGSRGGMPRAATTSAVANIPKQHLPNMAMPATDRHVARRERGGRDPTGHVAPGQLARYAVWSAGS